MASILSRPQCVNSPRQNGAIYSASENKTIRLIHIMACRLFGTHAIIRISDNMFDPVGEIR